ncbi:MAG: ABC transporter permease [Candidatus Dormibacteria bacterium]
MRRWLEVAVQSAQLEAARLRRSKLFLFFAVLQAVTFLVLISLFALTGSRAPTALVDLDGDVYARLLVHDLQQAHRSFDLRPMSQTAAEKALRDGKLVAALTIPAGFSDSIIRGQTVALPVEVDNVDVDLTDDIQRAVPTAIVAFGNELRLPQIRVHTVERDLVPYETDYLPYLSVSALALDALVLAGVLGATALAREWEGGTIKVWRTAPMGPGAILAGRLAVNAAVAMAALGLTAGVVVFGYHVVPRHPLQAAGALALCALISTCVGAWIGATLKKSLAIAPLIFGVAMPLYIDSGSLEPERFDGNAIWAAAHLSPIYYAVGVLEWAFHGLRVTPETVQVDLAVLIAFAVLAILGARRAVIRGMVH